MVEISRIWKQKETYDRSEKKILECILLSEPDGISTKELEERTGLNHDTISKHCKDLVEKRHIKKKNKKARYHLNEEAYGDTKIRAILLKQKTSKIMNWEVVADKENKFCILDKKTQGKYNEEQFSMFIFANRIGAYITYLMLEAIRPKRLASTINGKQSMNVNDNLALEWIQNAIDPVSLFGIFTDSLIVKSGLAIHTPPPRYFGLTGMSKELKRKVPDFFVKQREKLLIIEAKRKLNTKDKNWSLHDKEEENFRKLMESFAKVFPNIYKYLEEIRTVLDKDIEET